MYDRERVSCFEKIQRDRNLYSGKKLYGGYFRESGTDCPKKIIEVWRNLSPLEDVKRDDAFRFIGKKITTLCKNCHKEIILMIDEVDKSSDNQILKWT